MNSLKESVKGIDEKAFTCADFDALKKIITDRGGTVEPNFFDEFIGQRKTLDVLGMIQDKIGAATTSITDAQMAAQMAEFKARKNPN